MVMPLDRSTEFSMRHPMEKVAMACKLYLPDECVRERQCAKPHLERSSRFERANLDAKNAHGATISRSIRLRADRVIE
ncbi:MAG: hypothetical protein ACREVG_07820 [Burkholderiales bacterium]